jgi:transposase
MSEGGKRQRYTKEFKEDAVRLVLEQGYNCREAARRLGVGSSNLTRWVREHRDDQQQRSQTGKTHRELEAEIRQLKKENQRLQMEREILKKAAAFFAKESS